MQQPIKFYFLACNPAIYIYIYRRNRKGFKDQLELFKNLKKELPGLFESGKQGKKKKKIKERDRIDFYIFIIIIKTSTSIFLLIS